MGKLKTWRKSRRLTQVELAEKLGVTAATVSRVEVGEQFPSPVLLTAISKLTKGAVSSADIVAHYIATQEAGARQGKTKRIA